MGVGGGGTEKADIEARFLCSDLFLFSIVWLFDHREGFGLPVTSTVEGDQLFKDNGGRERGVEGRDGALRRRRSDRGLDLDRKRIFTVRFLFSIGWLIIGCPELPVTRLWRNDQLFEDHRRRGWGWRAGGIEEAVIGPETDHGRQARFPCSVSFLHRLAG